MQGKTLEQDLYLALLQVGITIDLLFLLRLL